MIDTVHFQLLDHFYLPFVKTAVFFIQSSYITEYNIGHSKRQETHLAHLHTADLRTEYIASRLIVDCKGGDK